MLPSAVMYSCRPFVTHGLIVSMQISEQQHIPAPTFFLSAICCRLCYLPSLSHLCSLTAIAPPLSVRNTLQCLATVSTVGLGRRLCHRAEDFTEALVNPTTVVSSLPSKKEPYLTQNVNSTTTGETFCLETGFIFTQWTFRFLSYVMSNLIYSLDPG